MPGGCGWARREPSSKDDSSPTTSHRPPSVRSSESWNRPAPRATRTGPSSPSGQSAATAAHGLISADEACRREFLSEFTDPLLTVHGQNDQLRLLRPDQQRNALDRFGDKAIGTLLTRYRKHRREWLDARSELIERTSKARELAQEADQLTFALNEIDGVAPEPGEDTAIVAEVRRLSELDSLRSAAEEAHAALAGSDDMASGDVGVMPALDLMSEARARIESVTDADLDGLGSRLADAIAVVTDVAGDLNTYLSGLPADPGALDSLLSRQSELKTLTRKYAADVDGVLEWADTARARLSKLDVSSDALSLLAKQVEETAGLTAEAAAKLSAARVKAAAKLAKAVSAELAGLAMGRAGLEVTVRSQPAGPQDSAPLSVGGVDLHAGSAGVDEVEFRLSAHSGAPSLPISKSASGGELSRVMLALEVVLAGSDTGATMVFDEVDAGVGGRAAVEIGPPIGETCSYASGYRRHPPSAGCCVCRHPPRGGQGRRQRRSGEQWRADLVGFGSGGRIGPYVGRAGRHRDRSCARRRTARDRECGPRHRLKVLWCWCD